MTTLRPVEKGDKITVSSFDNAATFDVQWDDFNPRQAAFSTRQVEYLRLTFTVKTKASTGAPPTEDDQKDCFLFVEKARLDQFKKMAVAGNPQDFIVTDDFQYGQTIKKGSRRWLVYQSKEYNKVFQRVFFEKWNLDRNPGLAEQMKKFHMDESINPMNIRVMMIDKVRYFN